MLNKSLLLSIAEKMSIGLKDENEANAIKYYCRSFVDVNLDNGLSYRIQMIDTMNSKNHIEENELMNRSAIGVACLAKLIKIEYRLNIWKPIEYSSSEKEVSEYPNCAIEIKTTDNYYEWISSELKEIENRKSEFEEVKKYFG